MKYLFGPVPSRRLGLSLGIDLLGKKICTYDCIYCEIGKTVLKTDQKKSYVDKEGLLKELKIYLDTCREFPDFLTFSGSGEPTLHADLGDIIRALKTISSIPIAVITNSAILDKAQVRADLRLADVVLASLDTITENIFQKINRPIKNITTKHIINGLEKFRNEYQGQIWLEILFCKGINDSKEEIYKLKEVIDNKIRPNKIQINTVVRPPTEDYAHILSQNKLKEIKNILGEKAEIMVSFKRENIKVSKVKEEIESKIENMVAVRPCTFKDIENSLNIHKTELLKFLDKMVFQQKIYIRRHNHRLFYQKK